MAKRASNTKRDDCGKRRPGITNRRSASEIRHRASSSSDLSQRAGQIALTAIGMKNASGMRNKTVSRGHDCRLRSESEKKAISNRHLGCARRAGGTVRSHHSGGCLLLKDFVI